MGNPYPDPCHGTSPVHARPCTHPIPRVPPCHRVHHHPAPRVTPGRDDHQSRVNNVSFPEISAKGVPAINGASGISGIRVHGHHHCTLARYHHCTPAGFNNRGTPAGYKTVVHQPGSQQWYHSRVPNSDTIAGFPTVVP